MALINKNNNKRSKHVGVTWLKKTKKWRVQINIDCKIKTLGYFDDEKEAACKYDEQATLIGRPVNFPKEGQEKAKKYKCCNSIDNIQSKRTPEVQETRRADGSSSARPLDVEDMDSTSGKIFMDEPVSAEMVWAGRLEGGGPTPQPTKKAMMEKHQRQRIWIKNTEWEVDVIEKPEEWAPRRKKDIKNWKKRWKYYALTKSILEFIKKYKKDKNHKGSVPYWEAIGKTASKILLDSIGKDGKDLIKAGKNDRTGEYNQWNRGAFLNNCNRPESGEIKTIVVKLTNLADKRTMKMTLKELNDVCKPNPSGPQHSSQPFPAREYDEQATLIDKPVNFPKEGQDKAKKRNCNSIDNIQSKRTKMKYYPIECY